VKKKPNLTFKNKSETDYIPHLPV